MMSRWGLRPMMINLASADFLGQVQWRSLHTCWGSLQSCATNGCDITFQLTTSQVLNSDFVSWLHHVSSRQSYADADQLGISMGDSQWVNAYASGMTMVRRGRAAVPKAMWKSKPKIPEGEGEAVQMRHPEVEMACRTVLLAADMPGYP